MTTRPTRPLTLVVGAGGLVGRHLVTALEQAHHEVLVASVPWREESGSISALLRALDDFRQAREGRPWSVAWCAGAGVVATSEDALAAEVRVFGRVMSALAASVGPDEDGVIFLASSAGGLYAGATGAPFDEHTEPAPLVPYGRAKLAMEQVVQNLAPQTGLRGVLGRLANVYGPGQTLGKPQGLLSQLCLADATGRPLPVYVSMDTIRDYLYVEDAATMIVRCLDLVRGESRGSVVTKVLSSGRPVTVGYLVSEARRVFHRPLRTIPVGGAGAGQVLDIRLASRVWPEVDAFASTPLAAGLARTASDIRARVVSGGPLDP